MPEIGDATRETKRCPNCDAELTGRFCSECGQSASTEIPGVVTFLADAAGAVFSYDHKLWRTLKVLILQPGQLTVDYVAGKRVRYLTAFQLFFWLQTIAFVAYSRFFDHRPSAGEHILQVLVIIGAFITFVLAAVHIKRKMPFLIHLVAAIHCWAFLMVLLLVEYLTIPFIIAQFVNWHLLTGTIYTGLILSHCTEVVMFFYFVLAIRKVYSDTIWRAVGKTLLLCLCYIPFGYLEFKPTLYYHNLLHWLHLK